MKERVTEMTPGRKIDTRIVAGKGNVIGMTDTERATESTEIEVEVLIGTDITVTAEIRMFEVKIDTGSEIGTKDFDPTILSKFFKILFWSFLLQLHVSHILNGVVCGFD